MILPPDLELWLCGYLRAELSDVDGLEIGNREPSDYIGDHPLIVIRDDGGSQTEHIMFDRSVGVTVKGWARSNPYKCSQLARRVYGLLTSDDIITAADSPIAHIDESGCNGPYSFTDETDCACYYATYSFTATGETV